MGEPCPCGSGNAFADCCEPFLSGNAVPPSAVVLMRSRYTAFVASDWDYLDRTQVTRDDGPPTPGLEWLGLEVLAVSAGGETDLDGTVEFVARYRHQGRVGALHEVSRFSKEDGRWRYVDGDFPDAPAAPARAAKTGRNDPCPCGSGRKYKKCCGHG